MKNFCSPHVHLQSLDSASTPEAFAARELELGTGTLTCTDHGSLAAAWQVYELAKKKKLTPIIGLEGYFRDDNCPILDAHGIPKVEGTYTEYMKYGHITMHAQDQRAYETMARLLSAADARAERHGSERKPLFGWKELEELGAENIVFTSSCLAGMVQRHLLANRFDIADAYYQRMRSLVKPGNFFVEVFPHRCDRYWVSAVFLTLLDGTKLRFYPGKKLRVNGEEIKAEDLTKRFPAMIKKGEVKFEAVKNYSKWDEREPVLLASVDFVEDYLQNECTDWAPDGDVQLGANKWMIEHARKHGDPVLVSDDSHFATPDEKVVQDIRLQQGGGSWRFWGSYHRQSSNEAFAYFQQYLGTSPADFERWVENSYEWAAKFKDFTFKSRKSLPVSFYPENTLKHTFELIKKHGRMDWSNAVYMDRLKAEIKLLHHNGTVDLLPYFFIDEEVCNLYEKHGLLTGPGRGSAAGLLLTYLLGITHVDPIRYGLSMDRFLTLDRVQSGKLPDIDQDLPNRDLLVGDGETSGWLDHRFGECYAQISTDTTMKLRSSVKDVARAMYGKVSEHIEKLAKKLPMPPQGVSDRDFVFGYDANGAGWVPGLIETSDTLKELIGHYPDLWEVVQKCLGLARQKSRHACAYVICDEPVSNFIPTTSVSDVKVTQYTAPSVEGVGGLKMDFLVVNSLNDIADCIRLIQERAGFDGGPKSVRLHKDSGRAFLLGDELPEQKDFMVNGKRVPGLRVLPKGGQLLDVWDLPEDQAVFRSICEGSTETVFQFNTPGARQWLRQFNHVKKVDEKGETHKALSSILDLAAFTALDRPGPLDAFVGDEESSHNMLVEFATRARGLPATGELAILNEMLPETHGIIVYQEQLQRVFQAVGSTTGIEANDFRTRIGKKKLTEVLKKDYPVFMPKAIEKLGEATATRLWDMMVTFGQYGFNLSHAVCYVVVGYACAYLKHHFPLEWWTSVLRNATRNDIDEKFWRHCGHLIDMPDLRKSGPRFEVQNGRIRAPLSLLHGVGEGAHQELVANQPYADIQDFCNKIEERKKKGSSVGADGKSKKGHSALNRSVVTALIVSGALDGLFPADSDVLTQLRMYEVAKAIAQNKFRKDGTPKADPIDPRFLNLNQFVRFQLRKKVLPAYSESLVSMILERKVPSVVLPAGSKRPIYTYPGGKVVLARADDLERIEQTSPLPYSITVAVPAYIVEARTFKYGGNKEACELRLDVEGQPFSFVKWGDRRTGRLDPAFKQPLAGTISIVTLSKWSEDKPFAVEHVEVVQPALGEDVEQSPNPQEQQAA